MDNTQKMLRAIINGQSAMKQELLKEIRKNGEKMEKVDKKVDIVEKNLTERIDNIGVQVAQLEDDAPTTKEFDKLEKRVSKVEHQVASL